MALLWFHKTTINAQDRRANITNVGTAPRDQTEILQKASGTPAKARADKHDYGTYRRIDDQPGRELISAPLRRPTGRPLPSVDRRWIRRSQMPQICGKFPLQIQCKIETKEGARAPGRPSTPVRRHFPDSIDTLLLLWVCL